MGNKLVNGLLFLGILGLLVVFFFTVNNLQGGGMYTSAQQEYLEYNSRMSVSQVGPSVNVIADTDGMLTLMPSAESRVRATMNARYEEQQGVSVTVYDLEFEGNYRLTGATSPTTTTQTETSETTTVELLFPFPKSLETLHDVQFLVDKVEPPDATYTTSGISWRTSLKSGETREIEISYKANGANSFSYGISRNQRTQIDVAVTVVGLIGSNIPRESLPTTKDTSAEGRETFTWNYTGLIANRDIQLLLPARLSFTQRIAELQDEFRALAGLAPWLVALFVLCLAGLFYLNGMRFRLEGYLLAGLGLALFYPFLTFTSGVIGIIPAAIMTPIIIAALLYGFLGLAVGWTKIWRPLGLLLLVFLVFFSLGMLTPWRGLSLTGGSLLLLGAFMLAYARRPQPLPAPAPVLEEEDDLEEELDDDLQDGPLPDEPVSSPPAVIENSAKTIETAAHAYCLHCGRMLEDTYHFCPGCGHDSQTIQHCAQCDHPQYIPPNVSPVYCVRCGHPLA